MLTSFYSRSEDFRSTKPQKPAYKDISRGEGGGVLNIVLYGVAPPGGSNPLPFNIIY